MVIALVVMAGAAIVQGTVGLGFAIVAVPILSIVHPDLTPVPQLIAGLPLTLGMAWKERHDMDIHGVGWIVLGRLPGAAVGLYLIAVASRDTLNLLIAFFVLGAVAIIATGFHLRRTPFTKFVAGWAAGTSGMVSSIGGPPIALLYTAEEAATIRSTLAAIFSIGVTMTLAIRGFTGNITMIDVQVSAFMIPAVLAGWALSLRLKDMVPSDAVRRSILALSAFAAAVLIATTLVN